MKKKQFLISHPTQLNSLSTLPLNRKRGIGTLILSDSFNHPERDGLQRELNKSYNACGCDEGAKAFLLGLIIFGTSSVYFYKVYNGSLLMSIALCFGGALILSGIGKLYGLIKANNQLKRTIIKIKTNWEVFSNSQKSNIICG